jgi:hypothetical protein
MAIGLKICEAHRTVSQKYLNYFSWISFHVPSTITIGAGCIGAPLVLADYREDDRVQCASPIFKPITYKLSFTNRKQKYFEE